MPTAGDEGYEKLVICPYDRAHEVRQGRMQFHLKKCRKNYPEKSKEMVQCPFNSTHLVPRVEEQYHTDEECPSRPNWDRNTYVVGDTTCRVKDLVPVNMTVPDGDENWDDYEVKGSVLNIVKTQAEQKKIYRSLQCESKAKRKNFRLEEVKRHSKLNEESQRFTPASSSSTSYETPQEASLPAPRKTYSVPVVKQQDPLSAKLTLDTLDRQFRTLEMSMKPEFSGAGPSAALPSSGPNIPRFEDFPSLDSSMSYAGASTSSVAKGSISSAPIDPPSSYTSVSSRPSTAMSIALSASASNNNRPPTSMSTDSAGDWKKRYIPAPVSEDKFCMVPIPGLGRGRGTQKS